MKHLKATFLLAAAMTSIQSQAQSLTDLGTFGGDSSRARAVSADGSVVAGYAYNASNNLLAFRWTSAGGLENLGTLGGDFSEARAVSADGLVVVGRAENASGDDIAFRWTAAGGMQNLGTFGGDYSEARAVSADGSVVVGYAYNASNNLRAFRWTAAGGMQNLGTFGGDYSEANAVSADGLVVVGYAYNASRYERAFRWTAAGGLENLGTLGGDFSYAEAVSADGSVVVGYAADASDQARAFRWTAAGGMTDLGTLGGNSSFARAVSADGLVVVGEADIANGDSLAFRWTSAGGMENLGTLGGIDSRATAVSADGLVVVGYIEYNAGESGYSLAFRWTAAGGMENLGTFGGDESEAEAVSADGSVVVGYADNASGEVRAFIYSHRVMLDVQDWLGSVSGVNSLLSSALELTRSYTEGAHHRPLAELGRGRSYWVTGDVASSSRSRDLRTRSGEAGATFEPVQNILLGIGAGYGRQERDLANDGSGTIDGQYLLAEADFIQADGGIFSVLVSVGSWNAVTDRGYVTGGGVDSSHGETDLQSTSVRLRYDTPVLTKVLGADIKGYVSGSLSTAQSDAYSETGGSYAGSFGELKQTAEEGRLGFAATRSFSDKFRGRFSAEWIHRFDRNQAVLTATDITSTLELSLPGAPVVRDQARFGFDLDYLMDAKTTLSFTVHAAGRGESADVSAAVSIRRAF